MTQRDELNRITGEIIGGAIAVHRVVGPGLLESVYEACLAFELTGRGLKVQQQVPLPLVYKAVKLECGYRLDLLVEDSIIVELKTVEAIASLHKSQLLSYLRLSNRRVGLLINFHVEVLRDGVCRVVNHF